jgi:hypothetical protein
MKTLTHPYLATLLLSMTAKAAVADRLVDPTRPASRGSAVSTASEAIRVEAILRSGDRHLAIVNGKIVRAGDQVGAVQILEVFGDGVRYSHAGQSHVVRLDLRTMQVRRNVAHQEDPS